MYATSDALKIYVETLHATVQEVSGKFFSEEQSLQLLHNSLLPARIICYASTPFGVGFEYVDAQETKIEAMHGHRRVEDLFVQAPKSLRDVGPFFNIGGARAEFVDCVLSDTRPSSCQILWKFPSRLIADQSAAVAIP